MTSRLIGDNAAHPLESLVLGLEELTATSHGAPAWTLTSSQLADLLPRLVVAENRLAAVRLAMLAEADRHQIGDSVGAANTGAWFANVTRADKPAAHRSVALARTLDDDVHAATRDALERGEVSVEQAAAVLRKVEALPRDLVDPETRARAEKDLVALAEHHNPRELGILGRRILDVIAPEIAEEAERRALEAEEREAASKAYFRMHSDGNGSMVGRFKIPMLAGSILAKHLTAIAAPKHQVAVHGAVPTDPETGERLDRSMRLGAAFVEYLETRSAAGMPRAGGVPAVAVVTMTLESLLGGARAATLDNGERISAGEARRLACEAGIIPLVLGGRSEPLDLGRSRRFHSTAQRIAIGVRDGGCVVEGCDATAEMSHIHHLRSWASGGPTTVEDGVMICPRHHRFAHDDRFVLEPRFGGKYRIVRQT
ncbi:hypothetical protein ABIE44_000961 [Marmoricola sp. OAE513]|uniref:HNH endonuclease signature motif containing protein n=1 Tax=Marmoricola sp. OAE513 TaxID=2817894 RepID=UPI001AE48BDF